MRRCGRAKPPAHGKKSRTGTGCERESRPSLRKKNECVRTADRARKGGRGPQQRQQFVGPVDQMLRPSLHQLLARAESPRHAGRTHAGRSGRLHVDARIAHVEHPAGGRARGGEDLPDHGGIGLQRHAGPLAEDRREGNVGEKEPHELLGARLELVRRDGRPHAPRRQRGQQLGNPRIGLREGVDVRRIVGHEVGPHERHVLGRTQRLGQRTLHQAHDSVAHEAAIVLVGVLREPPHGQAGIARHGQIADGVEQRTVEIENHQFGIRRLFHSQSFRPPAQTALRIFQPAAATRSDISGLTILKMQ